MFTSLYQGTLRGNSEGLLVFTNLLAHADLHGVVDIHPGAIADEVGIGVERVKDTLLMLEAPDEESRSPESGGRRIVRLDGHRAWGWQIVNYVKYRTIKNEDDRREQNREAQARWRENNKQASALVSSVSMDKPMQKQKQKKKEMKKETEDTALCAESASALPELEETIFQEFEKGLAKRDARAKAMARPEDIGEQVWQDFLKLRSSQKAPLTATALAGIKREADKAGVTLEQALATCCERGWRGYRADWANNASHSRAGPAQATETTYQRTMREKWETVTGRNRKTEPLEAENVFAIVVGE